MKINQATLLTVLLAVLVIVSAVQAYQLTSLKSEISDAEFTLGSSSGSSSSRVKLTTGSGGMPTSIQNLPPMVGGC